MLMWKWAPLALLHLLLMWRNIELWGGTSITVLRHLGHSTSHISLQSIHHHFNYLISCPFDDILADIPASNPKRFNGTGFRPITVKKSAKKKRSRKQNIISKRRKEKDTRRSITTSGGEGGRTYRNNW
ncbi:hypothetical protein BDZ89DRAFT_1052652 [Hymenopellis radicata]|nr:hypothetical protein BDZ89DRAFT_1052652 [Hymenopellis radicata]